MMKTHSLLISIVLVFAGGCVPRINESSDLSQLARNNAAAVVFVTDFADQDCKGVFVHTGRADGEKYSKQYTWMLNDHSDYGARLTQVEAGTYHIVGVNCSTGFAKSEVLGFGTPSGMDILPTFYVSYASFELRPGELVNAGMLEISGPPGNRTLQVRDLPPAVHAQLQAELPTVYSKIIMRPMIVDRNKIVKEEAVLKSKLESGELTLNRTYFYVVPK